ncbi:MAG TPA: class I SAM-dependent methyltransferase [Solirubrobacterales bacterium]|nr:class I SAM-dependent methyltransferase [Solirubrobacterales bacterium]
MTARDEGDRRAGPVAGVSPTCSDAASQRPPLRGSPTPAPPARDASVIWHEVECGSYTADLALWEELARERAARVLDLGCGTGRVALHLARRGRTITGLDIDPRLVAALAERADGLPATARTGDARDFKLNAEFDLVIAPMQLIQLLEDASERMRCLRRVATHLSPSGLAAFAIVEGVPISDDTSLPLPDTREVDGWVYSSQAIETLLDGSWIRARRLRQTVSPAGELEEEVSEDLLHILTAAALEDEAMRVGLRPAGRRIVAQTDDHVGSTVVLLGRES